MTEIYNLTIAEAAPLIAAKKLSPVDLTAAYLQRIEKFDSQLNAYITVLPELAMKAARAAEAEIMKGGYKGPLHGIPIALKDIYNTKGSPRPGIPRSSRIMCRMRMR